MLIKFFKYFKKRKYFKREIRKIGRTIWQYELREFAINKIREGIRYEYENITERIAASKNAIEAEKKKPKINMMLIIKLNKIEVTYQPDLEEMAKQIKSIDAELEGIGEKKDGAKQYIEVIKELIKKKL